MGRQFVCDYDFPVVRTRAGKIRGYLKDGIYHFKGVPYAQAKRFMRPEPVEPFDGILNCISYGHVCPPSVPVVRNENDILYGFRSWPESEDCQNLNIWTRNINDDARKPVLFYIHGGGLCWGSAVELKSYEAAAMTQDEDIVVVTINHRLNAFGFMNLNGYGDRYKDAVNVSFMDIEAALDWVIDNIALFGGDKDNITICGHSGGGFKVQAMMQIPSAAGKFQRAIVMSGCTDPSFDISEEQTEKITQALLKKLGISPGEIGELETIPYQRILKDYMEIAPDVIPGRYYANAWRPVANDYFKGYPLVSGYLPCNRDIPMMVGTAICEFGDKYFGIYSASTPDEKKEQLLAERYGEKTEAVKAAFREAYPGKDLIDLFLLDDTFRDASLRLLDRRAAFTDAPLYSYMVAYDFKLYGGFPAWHNSEISLVFGSYEELPAFHEDGLAKLSKEMMSSWAAFARNGDPNNANMPAWSRYTPDHCATMLFDEKCEERIDFDRKLTELVYGN